MLRSSARTGMKASDIMKKMLATLALVLATSTAHAQQIAADGSVVETLDAHQLGYEFEAGNLCAHFVKVSYTYAYSIAWREYQEGKHNPKIAADFEAGRNAFVAANGGQGNIGTACRASKWLKMGNPRTPTAMWAWNWGTYSGKKSLLPEEQILLTKLNEMLSAASRYEHLSYEHLQATCDSGNTDACSAIQARILVDGIRMPLPLPIPAFW
jgi:hypothetical protein